jgi:GNAT superfamily N-acetyltransferase
VSLARFGLIDRSTLDLPLHLALRSPERRLLGGLLGSLVWDWLQIDVLWVDAAERDRGYGRALLQRAEEVAQDAGCRHVPWTRSTSRRVASTRSKGMPYTVRSATSREGIRSSTCSRCCSEPGQA